MLCESGTKDPLSHLHFALRQRAHHCHQLQMLVEGRQPQLVDDALQVLAFLRHFEIQMLPVGAA